jgi:hypothetical protein
VQGPIHFPSRSAGRFAKLDIDVGALQFGPANCVTLHVMEVCEVMLDGYLIRHVFRRLQTLQWAVGEASDEYAYR